MPEFSEFITEGKLKNKIKKEKWLDLGWVTVYRVNGPEVREKLFIDFTQGGNGYRYPNFVPKNEVWVEKMNEEKDEKFILVHELVEIMNMSRGMKYNPAHDIANKVETMLRKNE